jgi:predicted nucleotidyltransferase
MQQSSQATCEGSVPAYSALMRQYQVPPGNPKGWLASSDDGSFEVRNVLYALSKAIHMSTPDRTANSEVEAVIDAVTTQIRDLLGTSLVGVYVFGSFVTGDFDPAVSDVDLLVVLTEDPTDALGASLRQMHADLAAHYQQWDGRVEVAYISRIGLQDFRAGRHLMGIISPGEPFHLIRATRDWVVNWYPARERSRSLLGPAVETLIPEIPREEYLGAVGRYLTEFMAPVTEQSSLGSQAYAVLSACRAWYTLKSGTSLSKLQAAERAKKDFPQWRHLIDDALEWRSHQWESPTAETARIAMKMTPRSRKFVSDMAGSVRRLDSGAGRD